MNIFGLLRRRHAVPLDPVRPVVAPDWETAAILEFKRATLNYTPIVDFHRDRVQERVEQPRERVGQ